MKCVVHQCKRDFLWSLNTELLTETIFANLMNYVPTLLLQSTAIVSLFHLGSEKEPGIYDIGIPLPVSHQNLKEERQESENLNEVCLPMTTTLSQIATTLEGRPVRAPLGSHISPVRSAPKRTKTHNCFRPRLTFSSMIPLRLRV